MTNMDNDRRIDAEFEAFRQDLADSARPDTSLLDEARRIKPLTAADVLRQHQRDIARTEARGVDRFAVEDAIHRQRIANEIRKPQKPGVVVNAATGLPLDTVKAAGGPDPLMIALERETSDDDPEAAMLRAMGIGPAAPGPASTGNVTLVGRNDPAIAPGSVPLQRADRTASDKPGLTFTKDYPGETRGLLNAAGDDLNAELKVSEILDAVQLRMTGPAAEFCRKLADAAFAEGV